MHACPCFPADWPAGGEVVVTGLCVRYRPELPLVLNDLSFSVSKGSKVGIVGRTGSGRNPEFQINTGNRAKVREFDSKRISDFRPRLHISFVRLHQHTGDTSANCRSFEPLRFSYFRAFARRLNLHLQPIYYSKLKIK